MRRAVPISALASLGFCERYFYLTQVCGIKPKPSGAMISGTKQHLASKRLDTARRFSVEEMPALKKKLTDPASVVVLPREVLRVAFSHAGYLFRGQVDKLVKHGSEVVVVDEKFVLRSVGRLRRSHEYQLSGYCHGLKAGDAGYAFGRATRWLGKGLFSGMVVKYMVVERHRTTREVLFASSPKLYSAEAFAPVLERAVGILRREVEPSYRDGAACGRCSLARSCAAL